MELPVCTEIAIASIIILLFGLLAIIPILAEHLKKKGGE